MTPSFLCFTTSVKSHDISKVNNRYVSFKREFVFSVMIIDCESEDYCPTFQLGGSKLCCTQLEERAAGYRK